MLQWLEDAFALQTKNDKENRSEDAPEANHTINPMLELFYGSYAVESPSTPVETQREKFSQYVVQVSDFDNLHDSLEASVSAIRSEDGVGPTPPANCHWFTHLPPVMLFELSRFQYNKVDNRAEKIHQRFNFPELLYMDRYLRANKDLVKEKRVKVQQLRSQLKTLKDQLATYQSFGSGVVKLPISDILTYTLEFSESYKKLSMDKCDSADINGNPAEETLPRRGSQPTRSASPMDFASASAEESKLVMVDAAMECCETVGIPEVNSTTLPMIDAEMTEGSSLNADAAMVTSDSDAFTEERELVLVRRWLKRWRENVLMEVQSNKDFLIRNC